MAKAGFPKTLVKQKLRLHFLCFPQNALMLTESRGEFSDLHSSFRFRALCYWLRREREFLKPIIIQSIAFMNLTGLFLSCF